MSEDILVVEYEPRYTERVKHALSGQALAPTFARDGDEAMRALENTNPKLIVLSSVIPKIATADLIRTIRGRERSSKTPILLTVSGYSGKNPQADAHRVGANDILPKPYSELDLLGKMGALLGVHFAAPAPATPSAVTSDQLFGDLVDDAAPHEAEAKKTTSPGTGNRNSSAAVDKLIEQTLSGVMPKKKTLEGVRTPTLDGVKLPDSASGAKTQRRDVDRMVEDTLSGIEKGLRNRPGDPSRPDAPPAVAATPIEAAPEVEPVTRPIPAPLPFAPGDQNQGTISIAAPLIFPKQERAEEPAEEPAGTRFGQYVLLDKIATGGMAEVWKAQMRGVEGFQKTVAIKKILPHLSDNDDFITMFIDEAKLAAQLSHNNIIHIYDLGKIASVYFIAMEYIDGHDLKSILRVGEERGTPMSPELAVFVASKIASALDYAHRKRDFNEQQMELVHRDVSPQNVLISYDGDIKLCDFGIAKAASKASHTLAGALKGKLQYMSPEQAWGKAIDRRSDIFALGSVLFELLTGRKLFTGDNEISVLDQVRAANLEAPSGINDEVPAEVDAIVSRALAREPENRYQTAGEMARDLDAVLYNFRPTPSSADLAIFMHRLYSDDPVPTPVVAPSYAAFEPKPVAPHSQSFVNPINDLALLKPAAVVAPAIEPVAAAVSTATPFGQQRDDEAPAKSKLPLAVGAALLLVALAGGGYFFFSRKSSASPTATPATAAVPVATASAAVTTDSTLTSASVTDSSVASPATTATTDDRALIDEEVRKRLAAERTRLEQQRAQSLSAQNAQRPAAVPETAVRQPDPEPAATQAATPPPLPAAAAVTQPPVPTPERTDSAPAPAAAAKVRQGDLVESGTPGLVEPQLDPVSFRKPAYPPMAKARKVEGIVVLSALVSEDGRVLDVRLLRGVTPNVGINEAATAAVRASRFRPATKDGVRVKAYKTVTVPFKL